MRRVAVLALLGSLCLAGCFRLSGTPEPEPLRVTFLDVGQGLAVLLECGGRFALYDTGPDSVGVVDSLQARGVDTLDWVVVSHGHRDHGGGLMEMAPAIAAGRLAVRRLVVGRDTAATLVNDSVLAVAGRFGIPVDTLFRGDTVWFADGVRFEVLWPVSYGRVGENRASMVMKVDMPEALAGNGLGAGATNADPSTEVETGEASMLLTGDLDSVGERLLLELSPDLSAELLQVPHHGSAGSNTLPFLSQVAPRYAVISVGKDNGYGHPVPGVLQKLRYVVGDSSSVFRTDLQGSVTFEMWPGIGVVRR